MAAAAGWRKPSVIPGFGLSFGILLTALTLFVLLPLAALVLKTAGLGVSGFFSLILAPRTLSALGLSFGGALAAALVNVVFGTLVAWVLERYSFPGRRLVDALVDLPFALPTAVAGIALVTLYVPSGWIGGFLEPLGIKVAFTRFGVVLALIFVGLPFVVRTVQPVLAESERDVEEAAALLGATRLRTVFTVVLPGIFPALVTGFALALARGVGEYGSVIFIAGNAPNYSEIAPLLMTIKLEEFDYPGATAIASVMLLIAFGLLLFINGVQGRWQRRLEHG